MRNLPRNSPCHCGSGKKYKRCCLPKDQQQQQQHKQGRILLKTKQQIDGIRKSGQATHAILDMVASRIGIGVTTNEINAWVHEETLRLGGIPAPLNYRGFPKSVCTSINEVICHGIPEDRALVEGDIINVDVTTILNGYYGDASRMFCIGEVSPEAKRLVEVAKHCLELGIQQVKPLNTVGDIGAAIQQYAEGQGYSVVTDFCGHGTGIEFHEDPQIPHYGIPHTGAMFRPGMVFTIEPMINIGKAKSRILADRWTAVTVDGSLSAQWEHTMAVTETGVEILT